MITSLQPHIPILVPEMLDLMAFQPDDVVLDGTLGFGGHAEAVCSLLGKDGRYIGIDRDPDALGYSLERLKHFNIFSAHHGTYSGFASVLEQLSVQKVSKIFLDLGMSSAQLDAPTRGFTFQKTAPLDMRMDPDQALSAHSVLNEYSADELAQIFTAYADIRHPGKLVDTVLAARKADAMTTTDDLITVVKKSFYFRNSRRAYIKMVSIIFQAVRIEVNNEFGELKSFLESFGPYLETGGRIGFLTFHSGEDRVIKYFFKERKAQFKKVNNSVVRASREEFKKNSRCRSALLRVYSKSGGDITRAIVGSTPP